MTATVDKLFARTDVVDARTKLIADLLESLGCRVAWSTFNHNQIISAEVPGSLHSLVIVPVTASRRIAIDELLDYVQQLKGRGFLLYVADEIGPEDYKSLARTRTADSTSWGAAPREIVAIVDRLKKGMHQAPAQADDVGSHRVVAFVGAGGGVGTTTMTLETGVHLAMQKRGDHTAAVLNLDFHRPSACEYLDLRARLDADVLARNPERLDEYMLEIFAARHSCGLDLFETSQELPDFAAEGKTVAMSMLSHLEDRYKFVLVDVPASSGDNFDDVLRACDFVFVTGIYSVPSVKQTARTLQHLRDLGVTADRLAAVITGSSKTLFGGFVKRADIQSVLGDCEIFYVREDRQFAIECVNSGVSMLQTQPRRGISKDIKRIAEKVTALANTAARRAG